MKHTRLFSIVAAALLLAACHDEPLPPNPEPEPTGLKVTYFTSCDSQHHDTIVNDEEGLHGLVDSLLVLIAENDCHNFSFKDPITSTLGDNTVDHVSIKTTDRQQACRWGEEMYSQQYVVAFHYYEDSVGYFGIAEKRGIIPNVFTTTTPVPLAEYLPGTWVMDGTKVASPANSYDEDWIYTTHEWSFEGGYAYNNPDTLIFTDTELQTNCMEACGYSVIDSLTILIGLPYYVDNNYYTRIFQINQDSMLVNMYCTCHQFTYTTLFWGSWIFLFTRQH